MQPSVAEAELDRLAALCGALHLHGDKGDIASDLLEPIASVLDADSAVYRHLRLQSACPDIVNLTSIGVARKVSDDYLAHFHRFDPFLHRLGLQSAEISTRPGATREIPGSDSAAPPAPFASALENDYADGGEDFQLYCHAFLYPNGLVQHTGFLVTDPCRRHAWVFNFHRPASSPDFSGLELARSRLIAACLQGQASAPAPAETRVSRQGTDKLSALTAREGDIVHAVARGLANKQIADTLAISPRTVENHLRNIYGKLHINTRTQLLSILHGEHHTPARAGIE